MPPLGLQSSSLEEEKEVWTLQILFLGPEFLVTLFRVDEGGMGIKEVQQVLGSPLHHSLAKAALHWGSCHNAFDKVSQCLCF